MGLLLAHQLPGSQVDAAAAAGIKTILFLTVSALLVRYGRAPAGVNDPRSRTGPEQVSAEFGTFFPCPAPRPLRSMPECFPLDLTGVKHARCKWRSNHKDGRIGSATGDRGAEEFPFPTRCQATLSRAGNPRQVKLGLCFCAPAVNLGSTPSPSYSLALGSDHHSPLSAGSSENLGKRTCRNTTSSTRRVVTVERKGDYATLAF
jgi:hypothetical protein